MTGWAKLLLVAANVVSVACLVWVLRGAELTGLDEELAALHWGWVAVAVGADILVYVWQGLRWSVLLNPVERIPAGRSVRAIYVGLFANELLPLRPGEVIRAYLQARWSSIPFSVTLTSAVIERVFDGIWIITCLAVSLQMGTIPAAGVAGGRLENAAWALGAVVAVGALILGFIMFHRQRAEEAAASTRWARKFKVFVADLHAMGNSVSFLWAFGLSLPHLLLQVVPIYALARAFEMEELTLGAAMLTLLTLRLGTVIPNAPGNLGTFQALAVFALQLFLVEGVRAKRFALVLWGVVTLPLLIAGAVALAVTGLKIRELIRQAEQTHPQAEVVDSLK